MLGTSRPLQQYQTPKARKGWELPDTTTIAGLCMVLSFLQVRQGSQAHTMASVSCVRMILSFVCNFSPHHALLHWLGCFEGMTKHGTQRYQSHRRNGFVFSLRKNMPLKENASYNACAMTAVLSRNWCSQLMWAGRLFSDGLPIKQTQGCLRDLIPNRSEWACWYCCLQIATTCFHVPSCKEANLLLCC